MSAPTRDEARERLEAALLGQPDLIISGGVCLCTVRRDDLRALLSDQPRPSVSEDQGASRDHALTDGVALEACSRMAVVLISNLRRGCVIDDDTVERAFIMATDIPSPPTAEDLAWAESVARDLPAISEAALIEKAAIALPDWLERARSRAKPTPDAVPGTNPKTTDKGGE